MDVLKNSEKIHFMDLHSLYGNLKNYEETKVMMKKIIKDSFKDKSTALFTRRESFFPESESDKYNNDNSEEVFNVKLYSRVAMILKHFEESNNKKFSGSRRISIKTNSSASKKYDVGNSQRDEGKCFNCGSVDHFAQD